MTLSGSEPEGKGANRFALECPGNIASRIGRDSAYFPPAYSFHATLDSRGTAGEDQRAVGVEDFNPTVRRVLVRVVPNLDVDDPLRSSPSAGRVVREGLEHGPEV